MKIIFLANQDYASHAALKLLASALRSHHCLILFSPQVGATKPALDSGLAALAGLRIGNLTGTFNQRPEY